MTTPPADLIAAIAGEPDQLDPSKTSAYFSFEVLENVYDTLVEPDADLEMRPALAESWDVTPDQLTWTFHLRRGVEFHDGSPFTADDVVYSYRRIIDEELANVDKLSAIADISAADPSTVVIRSNSPTPEPADQPRRLQGHGDRAAQERRERSDRDPPDRHRALLVRRPEERRLDHAERQPRLLGRAAEGLGRDVPIHPRTVHGAVGAAGRRNRLDRFDSHPTGQRSSTTTTPSTWR